MDVEKRMKYMPRGMTRICDMETSGPDKKESEKMANADWEQLGESAKSKANRENFVRDTAKTKTYEEARRSENVREGLRLAHGKLIEAM